MSTHDFTGQAPDTVTRERLSVGSPAPGPNGAPLSASPSRTSGALNDRAAFTPFTARQQSAYHGGGLPFARPHGLGSVPLLHRVGIRHAAARFPSDALTTQKPENTP